MRAKKILFLGVGLVAVCVAVWLVVCYTRDFANVNPYAKYRAMYAKPIAQWEKPEIDEGVEWQELSELPSSVSAPESNPFSEQKAQLGERLFNDPKLSKSGQIACSSCHNSELGFGDGLKVSIGHDRAHGRRNAPNIETSAFFEELFWDGRVSGLESQVIFPLSDPIEMASTPEIAQNAVRENPLYYGYFILAFGNEEQKSRWSSLYSDALPPVIKPTPKPNIEARLYPPQNTKNTPESKDDHSNLALLTPEQKEEVRAQANALFGEASFHKILSPKERVDSLKDPVNMAKAQLNVIDKKWLQASRALPQSAKNEALALMTFENIAKAIATYERSLIPQNKRFNAFVRGKYSALDDFELYGLHIFRTKGRCMNCHYGAGFSDGKYHNIGLALYGRSSQDLGRYEVSGEVADIGAFRTPSLINVAKSAPYMHNGISPNLIGVIHLYDVAFPVPEVKTLESSEPKAQKTHLIKPLNLSTEEMQALEAFLKSL